MRLVDVSGENERNNSLNQPSLLSQFKSLQARRHSVRDKAKIGLAFERFLSDLFRQQGVLMSNPFAISGEQIDGAFEHKGWTYLVEVKWQDKKQSTAALYAFQGKPDRRIEGTRGLFISVSGYHSTSIARFGEGRKPNTILWTSEHIEAVLESKITIPELLDLSIRHAAERSELLLPVQSALAERTKQLLATVIEASSAQVESEIFATVGRKFIPKLYIERSIQGDLDKLIHPERELTSLLAELATVGVVPRNPTPASHENESLNSLAIFRSLMDLARERQVTQQAHGSLRTLLELMPLNPMGRLHVITSRAGMGKTNLLCHLAKICARQQPTVFLTGRSGITSTTALVELIESKLGGYLTDPFPRERCFEHLVSVTQRQGTSLLLIIDALNEHKDFDVITSAISVFLHRVVNLPVVILASCRDVYWPFFDTSLWPVAQWKLYDRRLDLFSRSESEQAINAYFDFYRINATLTDAAKEKLSHPLILRFFCEAYGNPTSAAFVELQEVPDIRLKVLFHEYLDRKLESICHTAPKRFRTPSAVQEFIFSLADKMRATKSRDVQRDAVPAVTKHQDLESPESVYVAILGEDILLEEEPDETTGVIRVVFTYDEFMEYMIARSMLRATGPHKKIHAQQLFEECQDGAATFPSFVGVIEYLAVILTEDWQYPPWHHIRADDPKFAAAICRAVGKLGAKFVHAPEMETLAELSKSGFREVRILSIQRLSAIAIGRDYDRTIRAKAIEVLAEALKNDEDVAVRAEAVKCFETDDISAVSAMGLKVTQWWQKSKKSVRQRKIIISDDNHDLRESLGSLLKHEGWKSVSLAEDATSTIQLAEKIKPALIVTDMNKLGAADAFDVSGADMAKLLKTNLATRSIPVLLYSAYSEEHDYSNLFCARLNKSGHDIKNLIRTIEVVLTGKYAQ